MSRHVIALDAGGTKLLAGVVDEAGELVHQSRRDWPPAPARADVLTAFGDVIDELRDEFSEIEAVGVGLPANLDLDSGLVVSCRHLPLAGFAFAEWLEEELDLPVFVDNDATLAMLAEHTRGAAHGAFDALLLTIGTGIGGGIVAGGHLLRGAHGSAGEPGHMTIDADGPPCPGDCPGRGCLEVYVSGPALARAAGTESGAEAIQAARAGDASARNALVAMGERLGQGLAGLVNLLDPEVVVIGGGVGSDAGPLLLEPATAMVRERALEPNAASVRIVPAALGEDAGMLGAALLALAEGDT